MDKLIDHSSISSGQKRLPFAPLVRAESRAENCAPRIPGVCHGSHGNNVERVPCAKNFGSSQPIPYQRLRDSPLGTSRVCRGLGEMLQKGFRWSFNAVGVGDGGAIPRGIGCPWVTLHVKVLINGRSGFKDECIDELIDKLIDNLIDKLIDSRN